MIALVRYMCTAMLLSQRYLAPLLLFIGLLAVLTSSDTGPLAATYGSASGAMLLCAAWLTMAQFGLEDAPHRAVLVVSAGSRMRFLLGSIAATLVWCLLLTAIGLGLPLVFGSHSPTAADLVLGTEAQLTCAFTGIAVGLVCSRLTFRRQGYALALALALLLAALLTRRVSPVNVLLSDLQNTKNSADALGSASVLLAAAAGLLAVGVAIAQAITLRRD